MGAERHEYCGPIDVHTLMAVFVLEHEGVPPGQQLRVGRALQASAVEQQHNKRENLKIKVVWTKLESTRLSL